VGLQHLTQHCKCMKCGWNPEVSKKRVDALTYKMHIQQMVREVSCA